METASARTAGTPAQNRVARISERLVRIDFCLERDGKDKAKVAELSEEKEILGLELQVVEYKAKKGA